MKKSEKTKKLRLNLYRVAAWCHKNNATQKLFGEYYGENAADAMMAADRQLKRAKVDRISGYICHKVDTIYFE
jgi:aryl-alcohol dehydrogenase-like predicted oxidoreductase